MCTETERKGRVFLEERETKREGRERVSELAMHVHRFFAWGQRELERKLPSHCRICTQSTKIRDILRKLLQRLIQGKTKSAWQPGNYSEHKIVDIITIIALHTYFKVYSFVCNAQIISLTILKTCNKHTFKPL